MPERRYTVALETGVLRVTLDVPSGTPEDEVRAALLSLVNRLEGEARVQGASLLGQSGRVEIAQSEEP